MGHIERRQKEKEVTRKKILDTALNIAIAEGWESLTIRKIANAIEYTPPIVYEYFKNKDDLLNELVIMGHRMLFNEQELSEIELHDPKTMLILLSSNYWEFAFKHSELYQLMFRFDKPLPHKEIHNKTLRIKKLFEVITNDKKLASELMFEWICFLQGFIFNVKQIGLPPDIESSNPKELYMRGVNRFISNL